jgi:hypothetical protein
MQCGFRTGKWTAENVSDDEHKRIIMWSKANKIFVVVILAVFVGWSLWYS